MVALAASCLEEAARSGAAAADVFVKESFAREVSSPEPIVGRSVERGLGVRVFMSDGRSATMAATLPERSASRAHDVDTDQGAATARSLARRAAAASLVAAPSGTPVLPGSAPSDGRGLGLFDPDIEAPVEEILEAAGQIADHAARTVARCTAAVTLRAVSSTSHLFNSSGFAGSFRQTVARLDLTLTSAGEGSAPAATRVVRAARSLRGLAADSAVADAAALLEDRMAPRLPPSGIHEAILSPRAAAEIVAALSGWLAANGAARRGERIGSNAITITDDGRLPGGVASAPFDGEGSRTRRTLLVERGIVRDFLRDLSAGSEGGGSTGNGVRASFREAPSLRPTNLFIHPGAEALSDLLVSIRQGILITTLGRIPTLPSADSPFTVPFTGRFIHDGRLEAPLGGGYLAGTLREILGEVRAAAADLAFSHRRGSFGAPSLLVARAPIRSS